MILNVTLKIAKNFKKLKKGLQINLNSKQRFVYRYIRFEWKVRWLAEVLSPSVKRLTAETGRSEPLLPLSLHALARSAAARSQNLPFPLCFWTAESLTISCGV